LLVVGTAHRPAPYGPVSNHSRQSLAHVGSGPSQDNISNLAPLSSSGWQATGLLLVGGGSSGGAGEGGGAADGKGRRGDIGGGGRGETGQGIAPGALVRVRAGVLQCLGRVCGSGDADGAVKGMTWGIAQVRAEK